MKAICPDPCNGLQVHLPKKIWEPELPQSGQWGKNHLAAREKHRVPAIHGINCVVYYDAFGNQYSGWYVQDYGIPYLQKTPLPILHCIQLH